MRSTIRSPIFSCSIGRVMSVLRPPSFGLMSIGWSLIPDITRQDELNKWMLSAQPSVHQLVGVDGVVNREREFTLRARGG